MLIADDEKRQAITIPHPENLLSELKRKGNARVHFSSTVVSNNESKITCQLRYHVLIILHVPENLIFAYKIIV